jgi:LacI family transcriptional regulator
VIGTDEVPDSAFWNPAVTTVAVDATSIGRAAASRLLTLFGMSAANEAVSPPSLVVRQSCGCPG